MRNIKKIIIKELKIFLEQKNKYEQKKIPKISPFIPNYSRNQINFNNIDACKSVFNTNILKEAQEYVYNWVSNPKTIQKILKNYYQYGLTEKKFRESILPQYQKVIYSYKFYYYTTKDPNLINFYNNSKMANSLATCIKNESYVYVNCDRQKADKKFTLSTVIHELFHAIFYYFPLTPVENMATSLNHNIGTENLDTLFANISPISTNYNSQKFRMGYVVNEDLKIKWSNMLNNLVKRYGRDYITSPTENNSRIQELRFNEKIGPGENIPLNVMWDYVIGNRNSHSATFLLSAWASQNFPDLESFLNNINSWAANNQNKSNVGQV